MKINKLEQLRKYIFDREIERIQFEQVQKKKLNLLELVKQFWSKVYLRESTLYDSLREKKKWYVAAIFEKIEDSRSNA